MRVCEQCGAKMPPFYPRKTVGGVKVCEGCQKWHARTAALHNPTGEIRGQHPQEWYHGSKHEFDEFHDPASTHPLAYEDDPDDTTHWNTIVGNHFTAQHEVAARFASGSHKPDDDYYDEGDDEAPEGHVVHAKLHIKHPKTYRSEFDMDQEVYEHERAQGNHIDKHLDRAKAETVGDDDDDSWYDEHEEMPAAAKYRGDSEKHYTKNTQDRGTYGWSNEFRPAATGWLNAHPDKHGIAMRFRQRLKDQGYDGVVYGNDFEQNLHDKGNKNRDYHRHPPLDQPEVGQHNMTVPQHSVSAIPLEPHQIEVTQHHYGEECKTPAEIADPRHIHVDDRLPPASGPYRQPRLPDTDVTRQPGTPKYKPVQHDVGEEPLTSYGAKHTYTVQRYAPQGGYETVEKEIEGPLYHGGRGKLNAGDLITPGRKPNSWGDEGPKSTHVYFSTDKDTAASYSQQLGNKGHLYEVEPTGEFRTDYGPQDYKTQHPLKVVRKIPREEWQLGSTTASASNLGDPTDWDAHYPTLPDQVHRGMAIKLPAKVRDQLIAAPKAEAAQALLDKTQSKATGPHWSTDLEKSRDFSQRTSSDWKGEIPVVLHAATPAREDIETRPAALRRMEIFPYDHFQQEREVPVRKGKYIDVTGVSWHAPKHAEADESGWVRHDFATPRQHTAAHGEQSALNHAGQQDVYPVSTSRGITQMCQYHLSVHQSIAAGANDLAGHLGIPEAPVEPLGGSEKGTCAECFKNTDYQLKLNRPEGYDRQQQRDSQQPRTRKDGPYMPQKTKPLTFLRQSENAKSVVSSSFGNGSVRASQGETDENGVIMGSNRRAPAPALDHLRASTFVQVVPRLGAWHDKNWDEADEEVRDPGESHADRRTRHIEQLQATHGVTPKAATQAYDTITGHLNNTRHLTPKHFGMEPSDLRGDPLTAREWHETEPEEIDLTKHKLHTIQGWVSASGVAHKMFHPDGRYPDEAEHLVGDPDHDPDDGHYDDGWGHEDEDERPPGDYARVIHHGGKYHVINGNHRLAADLLMGHPTTYARVHHMDEQEKTAMKKLPTLRMVAHDATENQEIRHCLTGDTRYVTREGVKTLAETVGTVQRVLTGPQSGEHEGRWVEAMIHEFGEQPVLRVTMRRNQQIKVIRATAEHRWMVRRPDRTVITQKLRAGHRLAHLRAPVFEGDPNWEAIRMGAVFGDGYVSHHGPRTYGGITLWGVKRDLAKYFEDIATTTPSEKMTDNGVSGLSFTSGMAGYTKDLPPLDWNRDYLRSWLMGYFAMDGSLHGGQVTLSSASMEVLQHVRDIAALLGIGTYAPTSKMRQGYGPVPTLIHQMGFSATDFDESFFLRDDQRLAWKIPKHERYGWTVVSVEDFGEVEMVYCPRVPETESFVLEDGIHTKNCPFCGAGKIIGRQDGSVECEFCHQFFTVQVQPQFPNFPQTIDGQPQQIPGMPGQVDTPPGASVPGGGFPPGEEGAEDPAEGGNPNPFGDADAEPDADDAGGPPDGDADDKGGDEPPPFAKKSFRTVTGARLDEENYARHLAIRLAPDRDAMIALIRQEQGAQ